MDDAILSLDLMSSLGEQLARRFFSHDIFLAGAVGQLVGGVGLAIAELLDVDGSLDYGDILIDVSRERLNVNRLANCDGHCCCNDCTRAGMILEIIKRMRSSRRARQCLPRLTTDGASRVNPAPW